MTIKKTQEISVQVGFNKETTLFSFSADCYGDFAIHKPVTSEGFGKDKEWVLDRKCPFFYVTHVPTGAIASSGLDLKRTDAISLAKELSLVEVNMESAWVDSPSLKRIANVLRKYLPKESRYD